MAGADVVHEMTGEILAVETVTELARQHEAAAMDVQVMTAQRLGRSVTDFQRDLEQWATMTQEIAEECTYVLKKGTTRIVGPSIRFAELLQVAYRHIVADTFIEEEARTHVVVGAMARDLYRNVAVRARVRRNILTREGKRYGADMIQTTCQAAASLALRNAIIRLIPKALWLPIWLKSRDVAQGVGEDGKRVVPFAESVTRAIAFLQTFQISEQEILEHFGHKSRADLDSDDLIVMRNKARSIRAGELDAHEAFPPDAGEEDGAGAAAAADVSDRIAKAAAEKKVDPAPKKKKAAKKPEPQPDDREGTPTEVPVNGPVLDDDQDSVPSVEL